MLQQAVENSLLENVLAMWPSARVERLREDYLRPEWVASIGREYVEVKALKETEGEEMVLRRAKAFAAICREMPIEIFEDELIVGWFDYEPHGCALPVKSDPGLGDRLDVLTSRERNPVTITEEQKQIIREEIMPYWRGDGRHLLRWTSALYDNPPLPEIRELMYFDGSERPNGIINTSMQKWGHVGHTISNSQKVFEKGFLGIKKDAEDCWESPRPATGCRPIRPEPSMKPFKPCGSSTSCTGGKPGIPPPSPPDGSISICIRSTSETSRKGTSQRPTLRNSSTSFC
jgi:hypothetical protein